MTMKCGVYEDVVQEFELHQLLVLNMDSLPAEMKQRPDVSFLAWGSELRLHDAGKDGGDGWADLMIVDELGKSWIIEVKLSTSAELNANVWHQLLRYRDAARKMNWGDLHNYADRFLDGLGRVKPLSEKFHAQRNLVGVVKHWQEMLGRQLLPPEDIVQAIASSLKDGTVGLAVIADGYRQSVTDALNNLQHDGDLAYITVAPLSGCLEVGSKFIRQGQSASRTPSSTVVNEVFYKYKVAKEPNLTPSILEERLNPAGLAIWRSIIRPSLLKIGWDGGIAYSAVSGMTFNVNCKGRQAAIVRIAFSDADTKGIDRTFKIPGTYGLRVDFVPWYIKGKFARPDIAKADIEAFASRLYALGWRGSDKARMSAGVTSVPEDVYLKWSYMRYHPSGNLKDFIGRDDDPDKVAAFFEEMIAFCR